MGGKGLRNEAIPPMVAHCRASERQEEGRRVVGRVKPSNEAMPLKVARNAAPAAGEYGSKTKPGLGVARAFWHHEGQCLLFRKKCSKS